MEETIRKNALSATSVRLNHGEPRPFRRIFAGGITADALLDERTENIIGCYADKLVRSGAFREHERDDIKQELRLVLLRKMESFDPGKSDRYQFAGIVIANSHKNMLKCRDRKLKRTGVFLSLQDIPEGSDTPLEHIISSDDYEIMPGRQKNAFLRQLEYKESEAEFLASLSTEDRRIWKALVHSCGNAEKASQKLGIPARTILWHLHHPIAIAARKAGFGEFF